ncbi:RHS repeat-associated core domain-containing protein [Tumidithrix elongata RA019]|uniref:RHS repeat-associated core domain-containing protein n=1 Tax=Tumidithrix elongata BACA0141 TaxID=2716417 RepID=A0AAW9Q1P3_9CYAN|nr:RHS repeat-associated core domain-containing protein [Tumidithrix elongata RA019]
MATTERYVYDRDHIMLVFVGSTLKERYLYGANLDQVLAVEASSQVNWTLSDYLGTVRDLVSSAGVVQKHIKYDSFGNVTAQSAPTVKSRFGFTGREFDSETGLYYYRSRYYDSAVGRFISEDRIGFAGGDANLYRYVGNSATNGTDPFGLQTYVLQLGTTLGKAAGTVATGAELSVLAPVLAFAGVLLGFPSAAGEGSDKVRPLPVSGFTNTAGTGFGGGILTFPVPQRRRPIIFSTNNNLCQIPYVFPAVEKGESWVTRDAKAQAREEDRDPCDLLKEWLNDEQQKTKNLRDKQYIRDIVKAQKYLKCRNMDKREENY